MSRLPPAQIPRPVMSPVLGVTGPGVGYVPQVNFNWDSLPGKPGTFPPAAHSHAVSEVTGLQAALDGKQPAGSYVLTSNFNWGSLSGKPTTFTPSAHTHVIADTAGLQAALDGKQASGSYVTTAGFTWAALSGKPTLFPPEGHTHIIGGITGLQAALDSKQPVGSYSLTGHTHVISEVSGLQAALDGKQASLGFTPYNASNPAGYITSSGSISGNAATATFASQARLIRSDDGDRSAATKLPTTSGQSVRFDFCGAGSTGTGGNYAGVMTYAPWTGDTASTGDASYQLAFGSTAANGGGIPMLNIRKGIDSTWNSWYTLWHSGNFDPGSYITTSGGTINGTLTVNGFIARTSAISQRGIGDASGLYSYHSFQDASGSEQGWAGFGRGTTTMDVRNNMGPLWLSGTSIRLNDRDVLSELDGKQPAGSYAAAGHVHTTLPNHTGTNNDSLQYWNTVNNTTLNPDSSYWYALRFGHGDADTYYSATLAINFFSDVIKFRRKGGGADTPWQELWHTANFNPANYLPLTGGTLTGGFLNVNGNTTLPYIDLNTAGVASGRSYTIRSGIEGVANGGFSIRDKTSGTNVFNIDANGSVGIGTGSPTDKLDVRGGLSTQQGSDRVALYHTGTGMSYFGTTSASQLGFIMGGGERARIDSGGNFLVGSDINSFGSRMYVRTENSSNVMSLFNATPNGGAKLRFLDGANNAAIGNVGPDLVFYTSGSDGERMRIRSDGAVGIGTSNPTRRLTVSSIDNAYQSYQATSGRTYTVGTDSNGFVVYDDTDGLYKFTIDAGGSVSTRGGDLYTRDVIAGRDNNSGVIYLNGLKTRYLYFDGSKYNLQGAELNVNGVDILSTLGGKASLSANNTLTGNNYFVSYGNTTTSASPPLQAYAGNDGSGAWMSFHRPGLYALNMGLDSDNVFRIGGWSAPAGLMTMDMAGRATFKSSVTAGSEGFYQDAFVSDARNPIWRFKNADAFGLSYFQGSAGEGAVDVVGIHMGTATSGSSQLAVYQDGRLRSNGLGVAKWTTSGQTQANMTVSTAAPSGGSDGDIWYKVAT